MVQVVRVAWVVRVINIVNVFTYFNSRTEKWAGGGGGGDGYIRPDQTLDHLTVGLVGKGCNNLLPIRGIQHVNILTFSFCVF